MECNLASMGKWGQIRLGLPGLTGVCRRLVLHGDSHQLELFGREFDPRRIGGLGFARSHDGLAVRTVIDRTPRYPRRGRLARGQADHDGFVTPSSEDALLSNIFAISTNSVESGLRRDFPPRRADFN
jgi:hypothetical protein